MDRRFGFLRRSGSRRNREDSARRWFRRKSSREEFAYGHAVSVEGYDTATEQRQDHPDDTFHGGDGKSDTSKKRREALSPLSTCVVMLDSMVSNVSSLPNVHDQVFKEAKGEEREEEAGEDEKGGVALNIVRDKEKNETVIARDDGEDGGSGEDHFEAMLGEISSLASSIRCNRQAVEAANALQEQLDTIAAHFGGTSSAAGSTRSTRSTPPRTPHLPERRLSASPLRVLRDDTLYTTDPRGYSGSDQCDDDEYDTVVSSDDLSTQGGKSTTNSLESLLRGNGLRRTAHSSPGTTTSTPRSYTSSPRRFYLFASPRRLDLAREPISLRRPIGCGGAARVFEADVAGFVVAVKIYHQHFLADEDRDEQRRLTQQKLDAMSALPEHPHVLPLFGYRFARNSRLIVFTERMDCTLRDLIDQRRYQYYKSASANAHASLENPPFTRSEVLGLWRQIVSGIAFLHRLPAEQCSVSSGGSVQAVWHRDLKSENIMCTRTACDLDAVLDNREEETSSSVASAVPGPAAAAVVSEAMDSAYRLKVGDFDEVHIVYDVGNPCSPIQWEYLGSQESTTAEDSAHSGRRKSRRSSRYERLSLNVGTLQFMAPEMANKATETYDERVDIWSLGMILYELLTLELPYGRDRYTQFQLGDVVQRGLRPTLPQGYLSDSSPEWAAVLQLYLDCTRRTPSKRPSAATLMQRINDLK